MRLYSLLAQAVLAQAAFESRQPCTPNGSQLYMTWNALAYEWGAYEIEGCNGVNPELHLEAGRTYTFVQQDASNWYHPVGFSYIAGGAHAECKDENGEVGECPELGGEDPSTTIQYYVDDVAITNDESGFGLDAYEPLFFNNQEYWGAQSFKVDLTMPSDVNYSTIYYFCHIHAGMSAKITLEGSSAAQNYVLNPAFLGGETEQSALAIYADIVATEQKPPSEFDKACGTHSSADFDPAMPEYGTCDGKTFLCGPGSEGAYETCLKAIDCEMHHDMAISVPQGVSKFATFARQMIPHHQNAVSMAKALSKFQSSADYPAAGTEDADMEWANALLRSIINVQNFQIQQMQAWLDAYPSLSGESSNCYETAKCPGCDCHSYRRDRRHLLFGQSQQCKECCAS